MTTRNFSAQEVRQLRNELGGLRTSITSNILPALGLGAALGIMSGGMLDSTSSGLALSSAGYGLTVSLYELQEAVAAFLLPLAEEVTPYLSDAVDWLVRLNEETDGAAVKFGLLGAAAITLGPRLARLIPILLRLSPLIGGVAAVAADLPNIQEDVEEGRSLTDVLSRAGARAGATGAAAVVTGIQALINNDVNELMEFGRRRGEYTGATDRYFDNVQDFSRRLGEGPTLGDLGRNFGRHIVEDDPVAQDLDRFFGTNWFSTRFTDAYVSPQERLRQENPDRFSRRFQSAGAPPAIPELPGQQYGQPSSQAMVDGIPRLTTGAPQTINYFNYTINATSYDDNELIRRLQSIFDQEAVRLPGRAGRLDHGHSLACAQGQNRGSQPTNR